jgi:AcrR family transcriptional regulator
VFVGIHPKRHRANIGKLRVVTKLVKTRGYRSALRTGQAALTRGAILDAARDLFLTRGYAATTIAAVAAEAGVAVDTVYATVGPKPVLFRLLLETAISGTDQAVPAEERDYVRQIREAVGARAKINIYAAAVRGVAERLAPLHVVLRDAAAQVPELAEMRDEIDSRRAANMRLFADDLAATGDLRPDLDVGEVADVVWSTNSPEFYCLLIADRGWAPERFEAWLADTWGRLFLASPAAPPTPPPASW